MKPTVLIALTLLSFSVFAAERPENVALDLALAPYRQAVEAAIASDPVLKNSFDTYQKSVNETLRDPKLSKAEKMQKIAAANNKQRPNLVKLLKKSKVSRREFLRKTGETLAEFERRNHQDYGWAVDEAYGVHWHRVETPERPEPAGPETTFRQPPFDEPEFSVFGNSFDVDLEEGTYKSFNDVLVLGGRDRENGITQFFSSVSSHAKFKFTASVANADVSLTVAAVGGGSAASAISTLLIKRDGDVVCTKTFDHGGIWTMIAWASSDQHGDVFDLSCTLRAVDAPQDYSATLSTTTSAAAALGAAISDVTVDVRQFKIKFFN